MLRTTLATIAALLASAADAETHQVVMLDRGETGHMVLEPAFLRVQPGDTVVFVPKDPGHFVASLEGLIPEGAEPIESAIMGEPMPVTLTGEGVHGVECSPRFGMGIIALIEVGAFDTNLAAVEDEIGRMRGPAKRRFTELLCRVE